MTHATSAAAADATNFPCIDTLPERFLNKFSRFSYLRFYLKFIIFCGLPSSCESMFRLSGVFCVDPAIFRPKIRPGIDFGAKAKFQKKLEKSI